MNMKMMNMMKMNNPFARRAANSIAFACLCCRFDVEVSLKAQTEEESLPALAETSLLFSRFDR